MPVWNKIADILAPRPEHRSQAEELLAEYRKKGHLDRTQKDLLGLPDEVITMFYRIMMDNKVPVSPVADQADSGWLSHSSACFINVRATGLGEEFGNFLQAAKLLPGLRVKALHLAPFTEYEFGTVYAIRSLKTIAPQVLHPKLLEGGLRAPLQLDAFIQAAHALGKRVGFDLEPHTAQYSIPVLEVPEAFRWIKLFPEDKSWLDGMQTPDAIYAREVQEKLAAEVRALVTGFLKDHSFHTFDEEENDSAEILARKRVAFQEAIRLLIQAGYWTVPAHAWDSLGLPCFAGYNKQDNYPLFQYTNRHGGDSSAYAYHIVTPYAFYFNVPLQGTAFQQKPEPNPVALDLFCNAFLHWRDRHHFDFVRHDSVDHVFDSLFDSDSNWPLSDRPTPAVLSEFIRRSKSPGKPFIAHLAERMGNEAEEYAALGYDLMMGSDMLETVGQPYLEKSFRLQGVLEVLNHRRKSPFSIAYAMDTHDTGNPFFWGQSLSEKLGPEGIIARHFLSRFLGWGDGWRPKYEVMGLSDRSHGLFTANVTEKNLEWAGDKDFNDAYHHLEDVFKELRSSLESGNLVESYAGMSYAWWMVSSASLLMVFGLWYEDISAFSETGLEHTEVKEKYLARPGEFPFLQKDVPTKAGNHWNLRALRTLEISPKLKIWVIPAKV